MNDLNSLLIEGTLITEPVEVKPSVVSFEIRNERRNKDGDSESVTIKIQAADSLAKRCLDHLTKGTKIRCVGKISTALDGTIILNADHIEYRKS